MRLSEMFHGVTQLLVDSSLVQYLFKFVKAYRKLIFYKVHVFIGPLQPVVQIFLSENHERGSCWGDE